MLRCDPNSLKVRLVKPGNRAYSEKKSLMDGVRMMKRCTMKKVNLQNQMKKIKKKNEPKRKICSAIFPS